MSGSTTTQIHAIREYSKEILGAPDVFGNYTGLTDPVDRSPMTRDEATEALRRLSALLGTPEAERLRSRPQEIVVHFADLMAVHTEGALVTMTGQPAPTIDVSREKGEDPLAYATRILDVESEQTCPECGGDGTVTRGALEKPVELTRLLLDLKGDNRGVGPKTKALRNRLANPDLELLRRIQELAGDITLDQAVEVSAVLATAL